MWGVGLLRVVMGVFSLDKLLIKSRIIDMTLGIGVDVFIRCIVAGGFGG